MVWKMVWKIQLGRCPCKRVSACLCCVLSVHRLRVRCVPSLFVCDMRPLCIYHIYVLCIYHIPVSRICSQYYQHSLWTDAIDTSPRTTEGNKTPCLICILLKTVSINNGCKIIINKLYTNYSSSANSVDEPTVGKHVLLWIYAKII